MTNTVKARIYEYIPEHRQTTTKEVPVIDSTWFDEDGELLSHTADRLWELGIQEDCEIGIVLEVAPSGVDLRKPTGEAEYKRADDDWVRRTLGITDPRIILVGDRGNLTLEKPDRVMIGRLSELCGYRWGHIDEDLGDMRCPK